MSKLFISHSSRNNAEAIALRDWMAREGFVDVFLDTDPERGIAAGERWERKLHDAANRCEAVLFLVSLAWLDSGWCLKEFNLAHKLNKRLFGVLIEDIALGTLPVNLTSTWQLVNLAGGRDHVPFQITLPVTHEEAHVTFSAEGLTRLRTGLRRAGLDPTVFAWPPESDPKRAPYPGLRPLEAEDAGIFFGREAQTIEALDRMRALREAAPPRFLCMLGSSGSGKSSFLRAGLWPRLARDESHFLPLPVLRPERAALYGKSGLLSVLEAACEARKLGLARAAIREGIKGGAETLRPLLLRISEAGSHAPADGESATTPTRPLLVLSVDQGEELFLGEGATEGETLLALLRDLLGQDAPALAVVLTIRSDAFERLQLAPALEGIALQTMTFGPMPRGVYGTVIEGPAERMRAANRPLVVEPALTEALLADLEEGGGRDALPLLAFTLERLWRDYGGSGRLTLADYETLGRVRGSIEAGVEEALAKADPDPRLPRDRAARLALLRRGLIPWLAGIDPDTGSPRRRVARRSEIPEEAAPLVDLLVEARLLATDTDPASGEATIEPAHEALLRQWGMLQGWLEEDFGRLATLEGIKRASRDWAANEQDPAWLTHSGGRLSEATQLDERPDIAAKFDAVDRAYINICCAREVEAAEAADTRRREREEEQKRAIRDAEAIAEATRKRIRAVVVALGFAAMLILVLIIGSVYAAKQRDEAVSAQQEAQRQRDVAATNERTAKHNLSLGLSEKSSSYFNLGKFSEASLFAASALTLDADNAQARTLTYIATARNLFSRVSIRDDKGRCVAASPDLTLIARCSDSDEVQLEHYETGKPISLPKIEKQEHKRKDESLADTDSAEGEVERIDDVVFTARSEYLIASGNQIYAYDLKNGNNTQQIVDKECDNDLALPPRLSVLDEQSIAVRCSTGLHIINTKEWKTEIAVWPVSIPRHEFGTEVNGSSVTRATLSRQADVLAYVVAAQTEDYTGESNNTALINIVRFSTGRSLAYIFSGSVDNIQLNSNGDNLIVAKRGGRIEIWPLLSVIGAQGATSKAEENGKTSDNSNSNNNDSPTEHIAHNRLESYYFLSNDEPGEKQDDLSPNMYRSGHDKQKSIDILRAIDSNTERYAALVGGTLTVFDAVPDQMSYMATANQKVSFRVASSAPVIDEKDGERSRIVQFTSDRIVLRVVFDDTDTGNEHVQHLIINLTGQNNIRTGLEDQIRDMSHGFLYLGIREWALSCDGNGLVLIYEEADTRTSTRNVVVKGSVFGMHFREVGPAVGKSLTKFLPEMGCFKWSSSAKQDDYASRLVAPIGGRRAVTDEARQTVVFLQKDDQLAIWYGIDSLNKPARDIVSDIEKRTGIRLRDGMISELK